MKLTKDDKTDLIVLVAIAEVRVRARGAIAFRALLNDLS
jgi:hypothetical protein